MKLLKRLRPSAQVVKLSLIILVAFGLLGFKLGTLTPGLAPTEIQQVPKSIAVSGLTSNPLEAPAQIVRIIVAAIAPSASNGYTRLSSVLLGLVLVMLCYCLIKKWYGQRLALFGLILLITAPWFLHVSRLATNDILYPLGMTTVMLLAALWHQKQWRTGLLYSSAVAIAALSYVPGMLLLLTIAALFEYKIISANLRSQTKHAITAAALALALTTPLIVFLATHTSSIKQLFGIPANAPSLSSFGQNFIQTWQHIFIGGLNDPIQNLGNLPITNALVSLTFFVGVVLYAKHPKATRTKQLLALWLTGSALIALKGSVNYTLILPMVLVLAVGGIGYLLHLWLKTFPRNPFARAFGIGLVGIVVAFAVAYNIRNYYIAWPNSPAVRSTFTNCTLVEGNRSGAICFN